MNNPFQIGDTKVYQKLVTAADFARFEDGLVHAVCSTFSLAQAAEWAGRLFVLDMKESDEEGIGTFLSINHKSPAFEGETIQIKAILSEVAGNNVICRFEAFVGDRLVADGETGQKILKKEKLAKVLAPKIA
jgi:fluoroacetyl-CoA thioesterase